METNAADVTKFDESTWIKYETDSSQNNMDYNVHIYIERYDYHCIWIGALHMNDQMRNANFCQIVITNTDETTRYNPLFKLL